MNVDAFVETLPMARFVETLPMARWLERKEVLQNINKHM
jgi:hypothetical protein